MTRAIDTVLRELMQPAAPPAAKTVATANLSGPLIPAVNRIRFAAIGTMLFTASLAIGTWSGYRLVPSLVVGFAVLYATYFLYLNLIIYARQGSKFHRPGVVVDRWIGAETGQIGGVHPSSTDTAMHLELGTLSPARLTERAPVHGRKAEHDRRRAGCDSRPLAGNAD